MNNLLPEKIFASRLGLQLEQLEQQGLTRAMLPMVHTEKNRITIQGQDYLNLAGNDYLGLAGNIELIEQFYATLAPHSLLSYFAPGSGASRLMTGNHEAYQMLERQLANLYGTERALVFNSGYHINIGLLPALARKGDLILADKLCHASLIDGMRLSRARVIRYPHLDYDRIEQLLRKHGNNHETVFIVTESLFSMDGDSANLPVLVQLKEKYGAILYVDEAHGAGVRGKNGLGLAEEQGVVSAIDLLVGTFGKAWAGQGAFIVCTDLLYATLVNTARSLIFTTALPPVNIHWLNHVLPVIRQMSDKRKSLQKLSSTLRSLLREQGLRTGGDSQIVPVMVGDAARTVAVAQTLRQHGFWINAIRPPTVPPGTSRLRLSLSATMDISKLTSLPALISRAMH